MGRKRKNNKVPKVHEELKGLDIHINEFGEMVSNVDMDKINTFLTKNVPDKKLINRNDNAYQQEFKEMGLGGGKDEDDDYTPEPETADEEEDIAGILGGKAVGDDSIDDIEDIAPESDEAAASEDDLPEEDK